MQPETPAIPPRKIGSTTFPGLSQTGEGWCFQFLGCPSVPNPPAGKSKLDSPRSESDRGGLVVPICWARLCCRKAKGRSKYKDPTREQSRTKILKRQGLHQLTCPRRPEASSDSFNNIISPRVGRGLRFNEIVAGIARERRERLVCFPRVGKRRTRQDEPTRQNSLVSLRVA